ncbi:hypothetical protein C8A03DRAFT_33653 [Achaetomium macrosporum]|uniref:Uncharacterized protein n=1 Tax=Achaetomium macrosporum TaxID=79813 RepID=A0AAN7HE33_9PEZI|nr:hypothetical protein C8A03DRAFT_33653 [Achaetomium macrosporum]
MLLSVLVKLLDDADHRPQSGIRFSAELFALLSYPAIAAGHLLVRLAELPPAQRSHLFVVLLDLALPPQKGKSDALYFHIKTEPDADGTEDASLFDSWGGSGCGRPSITAFQHGVGIEGPTRAVQNFVVLVLWTLFAVFLIGERPEYCGWPWDRARWWLRTGWVGWLIFAVYCWCCLLLIALAAVGRSPGELACYARFFFSGTGGLPCLDLDEHLLRVWGRLRRRIEVFAGGPIDRDSA